MDTLEQGFKQLEKLDLVAIDKEVLAYWKEHNVFERSISERSSEKPFVFYEGPPSANAQPGIHHVLGRAIKDIFCRYKTLKGYQVNRKGGWDTHGLPIELAVEKRLGITKEDIGKTISVEDYNAKCRSEVMKYKDVWDDLTNKMGYWVDLDDPYVTFTNDYIESLWALLKRLYDKGLMYKGYTVQPFSPAAGTGLSSHELNQPGTYRNVKDVSATAQFKIADREEFFLAWTTTPWTLPSNTALAVGKKVDYVKVKTFNPYTHLPVTVILAKDALPKYFNMDLEGEVLESYEAGSKKIPFLVIEEMKGADLEGTRYEQLLPYVQPEDGDAFKVVIGDFVTTEDGTGIVHIAPSFGADDMRMAKSYGLGSLTLVDKQGKFLDSVGEFAGRYVKNYRDDEDYVDVNIDISVKLKKENRAFKVEKYEHNYPHCWRTDKPIVYYPLDSWFIKTTAVKDRLVELNNTINWKPASTGTGRFGKWLEGLVDWNLSRSRYWGTPLPIWRTEDGSEELCIGSIAELKAGVEKSVAAGFMDALDWDNIDLHKPMVDKVILVSSKGEKMYREPDLIDVWFDSGAMPYAQWHYPFENQEIFERNFPADFIAEGVDQTRGWFYTLHALSTMLFDSVSFKNVVSNGLVLDKNGVKMSKRLGNGVDPFETIAKYGADATRWYMISNAQPWDNLKFDIAGLQEVQRKFFGTLFNVYSFYTLYANLDKFAYREAEIASAQRPEIDRWILSMLHSLVKEVDEHYANYEPTKAARAISEFADRHLSNWYVRLCRRRFWKGEYTEDKISAYQTLYTCLEFITQLISPISPFFSDYLFRELNRVGQRHDTDSVHLSDFPVADETMIDAALEERMRMAQDLSSMILSLRKREKIKVRQPLTKILIPVSSPEQQAQIEKIAALVLHEVNVKEIEYVSDTSGLVTKSIKPNFKVLGKKVGPKMKEVKTAIEALGQEHIAAFEAAGGLDLTLAEGDTVSLTTEDVVIGSEDIKGWLVASENSLTVALDVNLTDALLQEGLARELINKLQRLRKERGFNVTDRINLSIEQNDEIDQAVEAFRDYICNETLVQELAFVDTLESGETLEINEHQVKLDVQVVDS